jgi:murein DD-endopeptidase MepM/ murein hydrolase activator NlpD
MVRTGCYGCVRRSPADGGCGVRGYPCTHYGLDLFAASPQVFAPENGVIVATADGANPPFTGYGPGVVLMRGVSGFFHLLSHLDFRSITVAPGQFVLEGQRLGNFNAEFGHVHYEVRREKSGPSATNTVDPSQWLTQMQRMAATPNAPSPRRDVAVGVLAVASLVGLGWLTLRVARAIATSA